MLNNSLVFNFTQLAYSRRPNEEGEDVVAAEEALIFLVSYNLPLACARDHCFVSKMSRNNARFFFEYIVVASYIVHTLWFDYTLKLYPSPYVLPIFFLTIYGWFGEQAHNVDFLRTLIYLGENLWKRLNVTRYIVMLGLDPVTNPTDYVIVNTFIAT